MNKALLVILALQLAAPRVTLDAAKPGAPVVYAGTRLDLYAMNGGCCHGPVWCAGAELSRCRPASQCIA